MDGSAFDHLTRTLTTAGSRRRALGGLLAGGFSFLAAGVEDANAHDLKATCKKKSGKAKKKCLKKAKKHNAQHACVPETVAMTCAGAACGTARNNNCGQAVACTCPSGFNCVPNGTCARLCRDSTACAGCDDALARCSAVNTEGLTHCAVNSAVCGDLQPCSTSSSVCPRGTHCQTCGGEQRCFPLAVCPGS